MAINFKNQIKNKMKKRLEQALHHRREFQNGQQTFGKLLSLINILIIQKLKTMLKYGYIPIH